MSNQTTPVTLQAAFADRDAAAFFLGDKSFGPPPNSPKNQYWYLVVDRRSLNVVFNVMDADNANYPAGLDTYLGSSDFYVFISTFGVRSDNLPIGNLYTLMRNLGATSNLSKVLQIANQAGTGAFTYATYSIAAGTDLSKQTIFDQFSYFESDGILMPLLFGAVVLGGKTIWILGGVNS